MEVIILAKSRKKNNYCIAGVDTQTGRWVRLVSQDKTIQCAVPLIDLTYEDGTQTKILDVVELTTLQAAPLYYQPENVQYDPDYYWTKIRESNLDEVCQILDQSNDHYIFHNGSRKLSRDFLEQNNDNYSLKLIRVDEANLRAIQWDPNERIKYDLSFDYNGESYEYLKITDDNFTRQYPHVGNYTLENIILVLSLADIYPNDQCHHKLVATVLQ